MRLIITPNGTDKKRGPLYKVTLITDNDGRRPLVDTFTDPDLAAGWARGYANHRGIEAEVERLETLPPVSQPTDEEPDDDDVEYYEDEDGEPVICKEPGCENPVEVRKGRGRRPVKCLTHR